MKSSRFAFGAAVVGVLLCTGVGTVIAQLTAPPPPPAPPVSPSPYSTSKVLPPVLPKLPDSPGTKLPTLPPPPTTTPTPKAPTYTTPKPPVTPPVKLPTPPTFTEPKFPTTPKFPTPGGTEMRGGSEIQIPGVGATQTSANPTGRQEPAVSLEWIGPPTTKIGRPATFQIIVKNTGNCEAQQITVRHVLPRGLKLHRATPEGNSHQGTWIWNMGTLKPGQQKRIDLQLTPLTRGDLSCTATVTFSGSSTARLRVREPKLAIQATAPKKTLVGDTVVLALTVSNPGDGATERVKLKTTLPEGLDHPQGKDLEVEIGDLGPGEKRSVQLVCTAKTGGIQKVDFHATARDKLSTTTSTQFEVVMPKLELIVKGPKLRYVDRPAIYNFTVKNIGTATASNVSLNESMPQGFKFVAATSGGRHDFATRTVSWFIGDLQPGQSREVSMKVTALTPGAHDHKVTALAARGIKESTQITTKVKGLAAVLMELVDLEDPIEVGAETSYEVRVTNTGSKMETNLTLICTIPAEMELVAAQGPAGLQSQMQGRQLVFQKLPKLAPRADAIYRIKVRGIAVGDLRFKAEINADGLTKPVKKEESTKVYGDE